MEVKSVLRLGIIGCGNIAYAIAEAAQHTSNVVLYAVASRSYQKALMFNEKYHAEKVYGSYEALVKDSFVDFVYIATPHGLHHDHIKLCLDHNKHVLCEKAFTINAHLAKDLFALAKKKKLFLMEAMWTRFLPSSHMIKEILDNKMLGDIKNVSIDFGFRMTYDETSRLWDPHLGGGALLDIGVYPLNMMYMLFGKPIDYTSYVEFAPNGVDSKAFFRLKYQTFEAIINISFLEDLEPNALVIKGTEDTLISGNFWMSQSLKLENANETFDLPFEHNGYEYELFESAYMIETKQIEHPLMSHYISMEMLNWYDEIRKSWGFKYPNE